MFGRDENLQQPTAKPSIVDPAAINGQMPDPIAPIAPIADNPYSQPPAQTDNSAPADTSAPVLPTDIAQPGTITDQPSAASTTPELNDLVDIKQQALAHLSPLVSHLEQTPDEKFRTTMMMIQASDNKDLIKDAFAAAQAITDDKSRAQALLDVINEINYFTQHNN